MLIFCGLLSHQIVGKFFIIIIIIIIIISFVQGIYTHIPEKNHVPREYSVSAILSLLFMVSISLVPALTLLYFYVIIITIIIIVIVAIELSLSGSSPYTSTDKTNKTKCIPKRNNTKTQYKQ